jgi:PKD domain/Matrixin
MLTSWSSCSRRCCLTRRWRLEKLEDRCVPASTPVLDTLSATSGNENGTVYLTGTYHDQDSQDTHALAINWGEGALQTVPVSGGSFNITHLYLDDNPTNTPSDVYTIDVTLTDSSGNSMTKVPLAQAVYTFTGTLAGTGAVPSLLPVGQGQFLTDTVLGVPQTVYAFDAGVGLSLDTTNIIPRDNYSIEIVFRFEDTASWQKVIDFENRTQDTGLYVFNGRLQFYPQFPAGNVTAGQYYRVLLTRSADTQEVKGYIDGVGAFNFTDSQHRADVDNPGSLLNFFLDDAQTSGIEVSPGRIALLRLYEDALTPAQMAAMRAVMEGILEITVSNASPTVSPVAAPLNPFQVGTSISTSASFSDLGTADTHTAEWDWGDGNTSAGIVTEAFGSGTVSGTHTYTTAGVYTVTLTVTDDDGGSAQSTYQYVVAYDPSAGFVTGGGWINSPAGAYVANPALTGKANFGFVSRYQNGNSVPTGNTEFQFKIADFNFKSTSYEWLVVSGAKARFRGVGTLNGAGSYGFELVAWDGQAAGGGGTDRFRIKIWNANQGNGVVYDNQMGAADGADPTTTLGGGSIVIHKQETLLAAGGPVTGRAAPHLTTAALRPIVQAAIDRWGAVGLDAAHLRIMRNATFTIGDLGGSYLGLADPDTHGIRIDDDAAGYGWFVDPTPRGDKEFAEPNKSIQRRMDLLSVIAHELGHLVGLDHDEGAGDVMGESLGTGVRRTPTTADVTSAQAADHDAVPPVFATIASRGRHRRR